MNLATPITICNNVRPIVSEKSVMGPHCKVAVPSGIAVLCGVFSIKIRIFANVMFLNCYYCF